MNFSIINQVSLKCFSFYYFLLEVHGRHVGQSYHNFLKQYVLQKYYELKIIV